MISQQHLLLLSCLATSLLLLGLATFPRESRGLRLPTPSWKNWQPWLESFQDVSQLCGKLCDRTVQPWNKTCQVEISGTDCTIHLPKDSSFPSILRTPCDGRIGNQLSVYATAWYFSQNYGMQPTFLEVQIARIAAVFNRTKLQMDAVCKVDLTNSTKKWENLFELNHDRYFFYNRFKENPDDYLMNKLLDIGRYTNALYFYKDNLPELRRQFQFRDEIQQHAESAIGTVKTNVTNKFPHSNMSIILVGIHVRRTDLIAKSHRPAARYTNIDGKFYNSAMAMFRFKYNMVDQRIVFLAASDDPKWLRANLRPEDGDLYFTADLFDGTMPGQGEDLAVLALCSHSIIGAGTYGQWGALLAGGETVYPTGYGTLETAEESTLRRAKLPYWIPLNISAFHINE